MSVGNKELEKAIREIVNKSLTNTKPKIVTGTSPTEIDAYAISFVTESTITSLSGNYEGTATGITYPAGFTLYGQFKSITLGAADDTIVAYQN